MSESVHAYDEGYADPEAELRDGGGQDHRTVRTGEGRGVSHTWRSDHLFYLYLHPPYRQGAGI